jgi:hypothetical protein
MRWSEKEESKRYSASMMVYVAGPVWLQQTQESAAQVTKDEQIHTSVTRITASFCGFFWRHCCNASLKRPLIPARNQVVAAFVLINC